MARCRRARRTADDPGLGTPYQRAGCASYRERRHFGPGPRSTSSIEPIRPRGASLTKGVRTSGHPTKCRRAAHRLAIGDAGSLDERLFSIQAKNRSNRSRIAP